MSQALKHRWSVANNYLAGITLDRWLELLRENPVSPAYWHRAAFITATACLNSIAFRNDATHFQYYLSAQSTYRKNRFTPLPPETIAMVNRHTEPELKLWNYSPNP